VVSTQSTTRYEMEVFFFFFFFVLNMTLFVNQINNICKFPNTITNSHFHNQLDQ
jgi:hypothetical protein